MNHDGFQERLQFVKGVLLKYGLQYNNFTYKLTLTKPAVADGFPGRSACTVKFPDNGTSNIVIRLSNSKAEGLDHRARNSEIRFSQHYSSCIRLAASRKSTVWLDFDGVQTGEQLDKHFAFLSDTEKRDIIEQIADVFSAIQHTVLPDTVKSYGGLTISSEGKIINGQMTTLSGGPWKTYSSQVLKGWTSNGVRQRVDKFLEAGIGDYLANAGVDMSRRALIHGDLTMNNMLFDPKSKKLTGLIDFDFSFVSHPCQEFFTSFQDIGGNLGGGYSSNLSSGLLSEAVLSGNFDIDVPEKATDMWFIARAWDDALTSRNMLKPSTIPGNFALNKLGQLETLLCPFRLVHPHILGKKTPEQIEQERQATEKALMDCLDSLNF
ncbi:hypothetical protein B7463_g5406, partial [Scytalidium lignicola]